jgi:hypothetical protein
VGNRGRLAFVVLLAGCSQASRDAATLDRARRFASADHHCPVERVRPISSGGIVHSFGSGRLVNYYGLVGVAQRASRVSSVWLDVCGEKRRYVASGWAYDVVERTPPPTISSGPLQDIATIACVGSQPRLLLETADDMP